MITSAELLSKTTQYISDHEPSKVPEDLYAEFQTHLLVLKKFKAYIRREKIQITMSSNRKKQDARRRIFISWYINTYKKNKSIDDCIVDLSRLLFVSQSTVKQLVWNYR